MRTLYGLGLVLTVAVTATACTKSDNPDEAPAGSPNAADGSGSGSPLSTGKDAAVEAPPPDCEAIKGGPKMVEVATPSGAKYCIDTTEVTQQQYAEFLKSATRKPGTEHSTCAWNQAYEPYFDEYRGCRYPDGEGPSFWYAPEATPDRPVVCIDWCDAVAFCDWAGKRLCGKVGGGSAPYDERADADVSQWYNACSNGGKTVYSYGDSYQSSKCPPVGSSGLWPDVASTPECRGANEPFSAIHDMSGSVFEWLDSCVPWEGHLKCAIAGGRDDGANPALCRCDFDTSVPQMAVSPASGFRCCKD